MNKRCQFLHQPTNTHWIVAKRLLRYLKGIQDHRLFLAQSESQALIAYNDADWSDDERSTGGYYIYLAQSLVS